MDGINNQIPEQTAENNSQYLQLDGLPAFVTGDSHDQSMDYEPYIPEEPQIP
ncbi:hypothetical protein L195_g063350, partial [Trifolium pratense]